MRARIAQLLCECGAELSRVKDGLRCFETRCTHYGAHYPMPILELRSMPEQHHVQSLNEP
jgi:hypothetical protein